MKHFSALSIVLLVAAASGLVQSWLIAHATVPAADSIGFVSAAQSLERAGLLAGLHNDPSPPVYPMLVGAAHWALVHFGCAAATNWGLATQVAAAVPLALAMGLSWLFFRRSVPILAAVLAAGFGCVLTVLARLGADGLSDSTHLALVTIGLWALASSLDADALAGRVSLAAWLRLLAGGMAIGFAQLARVEAAVVLPAFVLALAIECLLRKRLSLSRAAAMSAVAAIGLLLVLGVYLAACRPNSPGDAVVRLWGRRGPSQRVPLNVDQANPPIAVAAARPDWRLPNGERMTFGRTDPAIPDRFRSPFAACAEFARELAQSLNYVLGPLALAGLWFWRTKLDRPVDMFLILLAILFTACALAVAITQGYLAGRHLLLLVWLTLPWAGLGTCELGGRVASWIAAKLHRTSTTFFQRLATFSIAAAVAGGCLAATLVPLHTRHLGHMRAVQWLSTEADDGAVLDSAGYTSLYSGRKTYRYAAAAEALCDPELAYLVVEQGEFTALTPRGATMRELLGQFAEPEAIFEPPEAGGAPRTVMLFRWKPWEFAHHLRGSHAR